MGFMVKPKGYKLVFKDADMAGLEVVTRGLNTGQFLKFQADQAARAAGGAGAQAATERMLGMLSNSILSWNAEDENGPIPHTMEGLCSLDLEFNMEIIRAWMDAINGVDAPLPQTSADGRPSVEASIPMDVPSSSLAS